MEYPECYMFELFNMTMLTALHKMIQRDHEFIHQLMRIQWATLSMMFSC